MAVASVAHRYPRWCREPTTKDRLRSDSGPTRRGVAGIPGSRILALDPGRGQAVARDPLRVPAGHRRGWGTPGRPGRHGRVCGAADRGTWDEEPCCSRSPPGRATTRPLRSAGPTPRGAASSTSWSRRRWCREARWPRSPSPRTPLPCPDRFGPATSRGGCCAPPRKSTRRVRDPWPSRDLALIATFCVTGVREAEASGLNLGSLSGDRGARRMEVTGKGGKVRPIPIDASLEAVIDAYMRSRVERFPREDLDHPSVPVFVDGRGRRLSVDQIRYIVEKLYVRAGVRSQVPAGALVHALRHTFATNALEAGADVVELQELLGHASFGDHPALPLGYRPRAAPCDPGPSRSGGPARGRGGYRRPPVSRLADPAPFSGSPWRGPRPRSGGASWPPGPRPPVQPGWSAAPGPHHRAPRPRWSAGTFRQGRQRLGALCFGRLDHERLVHDQGKVDRGSVETLLEESLADV